ncbi:Transposon Ty3-G Gag-Pol polyprotein [Gossypium australe]|uniref:Transposon Ty3-G Gag-Pol polyprotein n=1 Tax=Gossypium australe TaxID=47621 RepID=A0A5B6WFC9_9ROSI|nr:Transposon Ty3-G Gag-Pol polyprotein [Gossypium australe]
MSIRLSVVPGVKLIKQKKRKFASQDVEAVKEVAYPDWILNVLMVKKANGKWRMCIYFTNLNKTFSKDNFPLPSIDRLVNASLGQNFIDVFLGYNQKSMALEDQDKKPLLLRKAYFAISVEVYVDDMLVKISTLGGHVQDFSEAFAIL